MRDPFFESDISARVSGCDSRADLRDALRRESVGTDASPTSSLTGHIALIVGPRAEEEMLGVEASGRVTSVQNADGGIYVEVSPQPRGHTVNEDVTLPARDGSLPVPHSRGLGPEPTAVRVDLPIGEQSRFNNGSRFHNRSLSGTAA